MLNLLLVLPLVLAIFAIIYFGHKKASHQSTKAMIKKFKNEEGLIKAMWENKTNKEHWLFKTNFPNTFIFEENAALNHELTLPKHALELFIKSSKSRSLNN